jgi:thermitase
MVGIRPLLPALLMFALFAPASAAAASTRIIVKREPGLSRAERQDIRQDAGVQLVDTLVLPRTEVVAAQPGDQAQALRDLRADPDVVYAEPDRVVHAFSDPVRIAWALRNYGQNVFGVGMFDADVDAPEAWHQRTVDKLPVTGTGVQVGVVDTGVLETHEDLSGQVAETHDFVGLANGKTGAPDGDGHGTHVAGIIAAKRDNNLGSAGVAPGAKLVALRALDDTGTGSLADIAEAFYYAGDAGIPIVNASLGVVVPSSLTLENAIKPYVDTTLFVFAAGNGGSDGVGDNNDTTHVWPCNAPEPNVLCVGASTNRDGVAGFSNYGAASVDMFAPGVDIASTVPPGVMSGLAPTVKYAYMDGTSMAAPHVAAAAALVHQAAPSLDPAGIKSELMATADAKPAFHGKSVTGGRLNAGLAVAHALAGGTPANTVDTDAVPDAIDECPTENGTAGGCPDADADGYPTAYDNCPGNRNADQSDLDGDDLGDVCDPDIDGDAKANGADNCPRAVNATQADLDKDGIGDACDPDIDNDSRANASDNCPRTANPSQADLDRDKVGDACDPDIDGDGDANAADNCVTTYNPTQADRDRDHKGDACDSDRDGDGRPNTTDRCPDVKAFTATGCPPQDPDHDGRYDAADKCPTEPAATLDGCPLPYLTALTAKGRKRGATITVSTSRAATVQITVQRKRGQGWKRVKARVKVTVGNRVTLKLKRLRKGRYRAVIVLSSTAGRSAPATKRFRVR